MVNRNLFFKVGAIFLLIMVLVIPMMRIGGLVRERQAARDVVVQDIARSAAYAQTLTGPVLVVPYTRQVRQEELDASRKLVAVTRVVSGELLLLPASLDVSGTLGTEERRRGIYRARIFNADTKLKGSFDLPAHYGITADVESYSFGAPRLALGISDIRGIGNALSLSADGTKLAFEPGAGADLLGSGVHAQLFAGDASAARHLNYEIALKLQGTGDFQITPVGRDTHVMLTSDWPHPSFVGEFLPRAREVRSDGFSAEWQTSFFATNMEEVLTRCHAATGEKPCADFQARHFGVSFIDPVDQYLKSERATKYAFLFIALTFAGFFLFEVLRKFSVHPVQYGLVGLSLAMFFLLLLSFSEHIGFGMAYAVSAAACVGLIAYYVGHVLKNRVHGAAFGSALAALYGLLYGILSSEDYALLMGSLLVFALLGAVMVLTRRVNWAGFGQHP
jgi:inner membrane protein